MSMKVIRNLGETFCKIDPIELTDDKLTKTMGNDAAVGASSSAAGKQGKKANKISNEDKDKKKFKKY